MNERRLGRLGGQRVEALAAYQRRHRAVVDALVEEFAETGGSVARAAELTGLSRRAVYNLLTKRKEPS